MSTIILSGQFLDFSGYAWAGRAYAKLFLRFSPHKVLFYDYSLEGRTRNFTEEQVEKFKKDLDIHSINFTSSKEMEDLIGDVYYFECFMPSINVFNVTQNLDNLASILNSNKNINLKKISMIAWETNRFSDIFIKGLKDFKFDHIILHTDEHLEEIQEQVGIPCSVNHYPVSELFVPDFESREKSDKFRILSFNDFQPRKGWANLIDAFYSTFHDCEDVVLRIKTHGEKEKILQAISSHKKSHTVVKFIKNKDNYEIHKDQPKCKIELDTRFLSEKSISDYYLNFDLFATATKGEGFGLTIAQAGLSGLAILCPARGGHMSFVPEFSYCVEAYTSAIGGLEPIYYNHRGTYLYECDCRDLRIKLQTAYEDWKSNKIFDKGEETEKYLNEVLSSNKCYENIVKIMEDLK